MRTFILTRSYRPGRRRRRRILGLPILFPGPFQHARGVAVLVLAISMALAPHASAAPPAWTEADPTIAPGVSIAGIPVGLSTVDEARETVTTAYSQVITFRLGTRQYRRSPRSIGQVLELEPALEQAWLVGREGSAPPAHTNIPMDITVRRDPLYGWTRKLGRSLAVAPRNARSSLRRHRIRFVRHRIGRELRLASLRSLLAATLRRTNSAHALGHRDWLLRPLYPRVQFSDLLPVVVVDRSDRTLTLWRRNAARKRFSIAVGRPSYPTPLGHFSVANKQKNPWWNPPDSDWAEDADPIPPGPDNPLGTRWIGLSASGVGIHGTPNEGSVGTAASHGCMRMRKRDVQWLFARVRIGSPVHILR